MLKLSEILGYEPNPTARCMDRMTMFIGPIEVPFAQVVHTLLTGSLCPGSAFFCPLPRYFAPYRRCLGKVHARGIEPETIFGQYPPG